MAVNSCGDCQHWSFKVEAEGLAFGECLHPNAEKLVRISTVQCSVSNQTRAEVNEFARIQFEQSFVCGLFQERNRLCPECDGILINAGLDLLRCTKCARTWEARPYDD